MPSVQYCPVLLSAHLQTIVQRYCTEFSLLLKCNNTVSPLFLCSFKTPFEQKKILHYISISLIVIYQLHAMSSSIIIANSCTIVCQVQLMLLLK